MSKPLILVVDDEPAIREMIGTILTEAGYDVDTAEDGRVASGSVGDRVVDLVLTDVLMPNRDGIDLIVELRHRRPGLPVVAMSGGGRLPREDCLKTARRLGAHAILDKPFTRAQLLATVGLLIPEGKSKKAG